MSFTPHLSSVLSSIDHSINILGEISALTSTETINLYGIKLWFLCVFIWIIHQTLTLRRYFNEDNGKWSKLREILINVKTSLDQGMNPGSLKFKGVATHSFPQLLATRSCSILCLLYSICIRLITSSNRAPISSTKDECIYLPFVFCIAIPSR